LARVDGLNRIWLVGYSLGGNLVLKAAGEAGSSEATLADAIAVCPTIDPMQCAKALEEPRNWFYHHHFLTQLKMRIRRKAVLFPGKWDLAGLDRIRSLSEFDDRYTAPDGGYAMCLIPSPSLHSSSRHKMMPSFPTPCLLGR